ncbi:MAG: hypothetical protein ACXWQO_05530 [Bdellovibrionota bacterium]
MVGVNVDGAVTAWLLILFFFPFVFALMISWVIWPVTFGYLVLHSPNKKQIKWWVFAPLSSLAGSIVGCVKAGFILWVPMLLCFRFWPPSDQAFSWADVFYVGVGCSWSTLFSTAWILRTDKRLHDGT